MTRSRDLDRLIVQWLDEAPDGLPSWVIQDAVNEARLQPQQRYGRFRRAALWRSPRWNLALAAAAAIVLVAVVSVVSTRLPALPGFTPPEASPTIEPSPTTSPVPTPTGPAPSPVTARGEPAAVIPVDNGSRSIGLTAVGDSVWATSRGGMTVIDAGSYETSFFELPGDDRSRSLRADGDMVWLTDYYGRTVYRLDALSGEVLGRISVPGEPRHLVIGGGSVWVRLNDGRTIEIDAATDSIVGDPLPYRVTAHGLDSLWVSRPGTVLRIDASTREQLASIEVPALPSSCHVSGEFPDSVWGWCGLNPINPIVTRIDPLNDTAAATVDIGGLLGSIDGLVMVEGEAWFPVMPGPVPGTPGRLVRVNGVTNRVDRIVTLGPDFDPNDAVVAADGLWVSNESTQAVWRIPLSELTGD
jgi:hypothetical protein